MERKASTAALDLDVSQKLSLRQWRTLGHPAGGWKNEVKEIKR
jgi:hypothetical protein